MKQKVDSEDRLSLLDGMLLSFVPKCGQVITVKILADLLFKTCAASFSGLDRDSPRRRKQLACKLMVQPPSVTPLQ